MISNIHTHSTFCDGHNTPEQMIRQAIQEGLQCLGFSGHSYAPFDPTCGMTPGETAAYRRELLRLKALYRDQICIFIGLEQDFDSPEDDLTWDYRIGSIHYMEHDGVYHPIDHTPEKLLRCITEVYHGQMHRFVQDYCDKELRMVQERHPEVIGHFDLYRKFNDAHAYLDENDPIYLGIVKDTLTQMVRQDVLFEVNTGGMARGMCRTPYPSMPLLKILQSLHARLIITTDAHSAKHLTYGYEEARHLLEEAGFTSMMAMGPDGFYETSVSSSRMR